MEHQMNINGLIDEQSSVFIWGCGLAGRWLNLQMPGRVRGFIDSDRKKSGKIFNEVEVYTVEEAAKLTDGSTIILITVVDIQDVVGLVRLVPHEKIIPLGLHLNDELAKREGFEESEEFISYSLKAVEVCHKGYYSKDKLFLRSIDLIITEKCSLRCRDCANLMQYYESPKDVPLGELRESVDALMSRVDEVYEMRIIGGEPFMNKDIYDVIECVVAHPRIKKVVIYSNAMIPLKSDRKELLTHPKVVLSLTDYGPLAKNTSRVAAFLDEIGAVYRLHDPENWTDSGVIENFERTEDELKNLFSDCCGKNLITQSAGRLYRCPFAANVDRLQAVPFDARNSVALNEEKTAIRKYIREIDFLPVCNYCKGRSFGAAEIVPAIQSGKPLLYKRYPILEA
jgi:organic radical activating enzyme